MEIKILGAGCSRYLFFRCGAVDKQSGGEKRKGAVIDLSMSCPPLFSWWGGRPDSNRRPSEPQSDVLTY